MSVDGGCNRVHYLPADVGLSRKLSYLLFVLLCELDDVLITKAPDVVGLNDGLEDWEAVLNI